VQALKSDPAPQVRWAAAWALFRIASATPAVIAGLRAAANDPDPDVRQQAERVLDLMR
jgi:HEAT repeat protein